MRGMKLATLLLLLAVTAAGELPNTGDIINGRSWRDLLDHSHKLGYVFGVDQGARVFVPFACRKASDLDACVSAAEEFRKSFFGKSTMAEIVEGVDDFYRDPANIQIPATDAMIYFQLKLNGANPGRLAQILADLRRISAAR
jgi:hypothetical protein